MVRRLARAAPAAVLPEPVEPTAEMQAEFIWVCAEHHIDIVGPPLHP